MKDNHSPSFCSAQIRHMLPGLLIVLLPLTLLTPLLQGRMPYAHDHPVHLYKAWHFWEMMLWHGRLQGWSSDWFFGYPAEELYPIGPDLWVAAWRAVTLGLLSWEATYALAFAACFALAAWAVYVLGARLLGRGAGWIGAVIWVLDPGGGFEEGGWEYVIHFGVWGQILAMAFLLLALVQLHGYLECKNGKNFAGCSLLLGAAILSHPTTLILIGIGLPLFLVVRYFTEKRCIRREAAITLVVVAQGVAVAGFWLIPMLAHQEWTNNIGHQWISLTQLTERLREQGTLFEDGWPVVTILAGIGGFLALYKRRSGALFLLLFGGVLLFAATWTAYDIFYLEAISETFTKVQYPRLTIPAKVCIYLLAGSGLAEGWGRVMRGRASRPEASIAPTSGQFGIIAMVVLVSGWLLYAGTNSFLDLRQRAQSSLDLAGDPWWWEGYTAFLKWSAAEQEHTQDFYRIAFLPPEDKDWTHWLMGAPATNHTPLYRIGYTPAKLFKHAPEIFDRGLFQLLSVRYVVSTRELNQPDMILEHVFDPFMVYRFNGYHSERYTLVGSGVVRDTKFMEEYISMQLTDIAPDTRVKLHVANYVRWEARLNGELLPISEVPAVPGGPPLLMEVPVRDGELVVRYVRGAADLIGGLATLLGIGVAGLVMFMDRLALNFLVIHLRPLSVPTIRWSWRALLVFVGLILLLVGYRLATAPSREGSRKSPPQIVVPPHTHSTKDYTSQ